MKKRKGFLFGMLLLLFCFCIGGQNVQAAGKKITAETKTAAAKKTGWVTKNGKRYYYVKGKKQINCWKTISKKKYYFGSDGAAKTGWYSIGSKSYYFDSKGVYKKSKTMDKTLLNKMDAIIKNNVSAKDGKSAALKKLFTYVQKKCNYARVIGFKGQKGWEYTYAKQMLVKKKGSCYHYAAAFAVLAKRVTGYPVRICWGTSNAFNTRKWQPHGWVEIKINGTWYTFDANAARFSTLRKGKWYMQKRSAMEGKIYKTQKIVNIEL
ncbi:MAG: transglutaminase domain-containing protein [Eubacteriales bacterium]|nr:transglutaminase domain-containing protein [Eubacteriales bacterium]